MNFCRKLRNVNCYLQLSGIKVFTRVVVFGHWRDLLPHDCVPPNKVRLKLRSAARFTHMKVGFTAEGDRLQPESHVIRFNVDVEMSLCIFIEFAFALKRIWYRAISSRLYMSAFFSLKHHSYLSDSGLPG